MNWITTEFSLLYRWHSLVPAQMTRAGQTYAVGETLTNNFLVIESGLGSAPVELSQQNASAIGPMNTAEAIGFEIRAIEQGRECEVAPFADYCRYLSINPPAALRIIPPNLRWWPRFAIFVAIPRRLISPLACSCRTLSRMERCPNSCSRWLPSMPFRRR